MWRFVVVLLPFFSWSQISMNVELLDNWKSGAIVGASDSLKYSDCWGYAMNGREYAMLGSTEGVHFFEIETDGHLREVDFVEGKYAHPSVVHRDIKTYEHYALMVCDEGFSSLQIVDLQYLPDSVHVVYENDSTFTRVHNLFIDASSNLMYACLVQPSSNGMLQSLIPMQVYDISDILQPTLVYEGPTDLPEVHDAFVRNNIAYLNCGFDGVRVYNFSNPAAPVFIQNLGFYQDQGYNHQGWLSPDGSKYVFGDETNGSSLKLCVVENNQITIEGRFNTNDEDGSVPHNVMITNDYAFVAYYNEGLRIYDIRQKLPKEIAHYDTYPEEEPLFKMNGAWGVYSELPSERLLVSDRKNGLFVLDFERAVFQSAIPDDISIYPVPVAPSEPLTIRLEKGDPLGFTVDLFDALGRRVLARRVDFADYAVLTAPDAAGMYTLRISYTTEDQAEIAFEKKVVVF